MALTLGEKWVSAVTLQVDVMYGVGARPEELKHLRRRDIRASGTTGNGGLSSPSKPPSQRRVTSRSSMSRSQTARNATWR